MIPESTKGECLCRILNIMRIQVICSQQLLTALQLTVSQTLVILDSLARHWLVPIHSSIHELKDNCKHALAGCSGHGFHNIIRKSELTVLLEFSLVKANEMLMIFIGTTCLLVN